MQTQEQFNKMESAKSVFFLMLDHLNTVRPLKSTDFLKGRKHLRKIYGIEILNKNKA
jgi:hypothetical protein